jgi:hypothetical protein
MVSTFSRVAVALNPKSIPSRRRISKAFVIFEKTPGPLLSSVSRSKPSTLIPIATFPRRASCRQSISSSSVPLVYVRKYMSWWILKRRRSCSASKNGSPPDMTTKKMPSVARLSEDSVHFSEAERLILAVDAGVAASAGEGTAHSWAHDEKGWNPVSSDALGAADPVAGNELIIDKAAGNTAPRGRGELPSDP